MSPIEFAMEARVLPLYMKVSCAPAGYREYLTFVTCHTGRLAGGSVLLDVRVKQMPASV